MTIQQVGPLARGTLKCPETMQDHANNTMRQEMHKQLIQFMIPSQSFFIPTIQATRWAKVEEIQYGSMMWP